MRFLDPTFVKTLWHQSAYTLPSVYPPRCSSSAFFRSSSTYCSPLPSSSSHSSSSALSIPEAVLLLASHLFLQPSPFEHRGTYVRKEQAYAASPTCASIAQPLKSIALTLTWRICSTIHDVSLSHYMSLAIGHQNGRLVVLASGLPSPDPLEFCFSPCFHSGSIPGILTALTPWGTGEADETWKWE